MYAVIDTGCHQHRVASGDTIRIDLHSGKVGDSINFDRVLMIGQDGQNVYGTPVVSGASVEAKITSHDRDETIWVFKYRRRKNSKKSRGHRQPYTVVEIGAIKN